MGVGTAEKVGDSIGIGTIRGNGGYFGETGGNAISGSPMQATRTEFESRAIIAAFTISNAPSQPEYVTL